MGMLLPAHETHSVVLCSCFQHHNSPLHLNNSINEQDKILFLKIKACYTRLWLWSRFVAILYWFVAILYWDQRLCMEAKGKSQGLGYFCKDKPLDQNNQINALLYSFTELKSSPALQQVAILARYLSSAVLHCIQSPFGNSAVFTDMQWMLQLDLTAVHQILLRKLSFDIYKVMNLE